MKCCICGKELPPDSKFCQYCGGDLSKQKYCPSCGFSLQDGMNFCPKCGESLSDAATARAAAANSAPSISEVAVIPTGESSDVIASAAKPTELSEERGPSMDFREEMPACPTDVRGTLKEKADDLEGPISDPDVEPLAEEESEEESQEKSRPLDAEARIKETAEVGGGASSDGKKDRRVWKIALCVVAVMAVGIYLWIHGGQSNSHPAPDVDMSEIANSVLYLEVFDENDELIGSASGFLVNDQTTLVTNYHVVQDASHIVATIADGTQSTDVSSILAYDEIADLAILNCDSKAMAEPLVVGDSETVRQGNAVYAIGYPLGLANTLSNGIVSSRYTDEYENDIIQVTAAISEGNSGGPLLDINGHVVGVMCAYYVYGQNLNIAIASNTLKDLLESSYEKADLKDWKDRPAMPDAEAEAEEIQDPEVREEGEDPTGNAGSSAAPEMSGAVDEDRPQVGASNTGAPNNGAFSGEAPSNGAPNTGEPNRAESAATRKPEEILQGAWTRGPVDSIPFIQYDYFEFSGDHVYNESYYYNSYEEFILVYTGTFTIDESGALCLHMTREETHFADGSQEINDIDTDWSPRPITALNEDSYTTSGSLTYHRTSSRPMKRSEWETNRQKEMVTAFSALSEWITNNSNSTMSGDKAYQEILNGEDCVKTYQVIYSAGIDQICLLHTIGYHDGLSVMTFLWLTPTGNTFHSTFYESDTVNSVNIFEGSGTIHAPSFNENSTYVFDSYKGDSSMMDTCQPVAAYMILDSLNFLDYLFVLRASPSGYYFSTSDFGFDL